MCKTGLHPLYVNVELITPDHHVVSWHDELWQRCILRENTCTLKFSERSSYNATVPLNFNAFLEKAKLKDDGNNYMD